MWYAYGTGEMHTEFWWRDMMEGNHLEDLGVDWKIILKCIFEKLGFGGLEWIAVAREGDR
jgi:hypothetical protein